jgi:hypothetical protein
MAGVIGSANRAACPQPTGEYKMFGTMVLADSIIHWKQEDEEVEVTVRDAVNGTHENYTCRADDFYKAVMLAMAGDDLEDNESLTEWTHAAERAMPEDQDLRWIP